MRIGILTNVRAGGRGARAQRVLDRALTAPDVVHAETHDGRDATAALSALADQGADVIAVNGGDGTLQRTLTLLHGAESPFKTMPLIAPLRSGRTSMSALDIGSRRDPVDAFELLRHRSRNGGIERSIVERPVLRVSVEPDAVVACGMFLGVGVIHRATKLTHSIFPTGRAQGVLGTGLVTAALAARVAVGNTGDVLVPDDLGVSLDGHALDEAVGEAAKKNGNLNGHAPDKRRYQLVIMTTLSRLVLKIRPFWGRELAPIRFTALRPGNGHRLASMARILAGKPPLNGTPDPRYASRNANRVDLLMDCGMTLDGEPFEPSPGRRVTVQAHERVRFVETR